jgi:hypothetical protein
VLCDGTAVLLEESESDTEMVTVGDKVEDCEALLADADWLGDIECVSE